MRILHLAMPGEFGGLETVVGLLAAAQRRRGHAVHVGALLETPRVPPALFGRLEAAGVAVYALPVRARGYLAERRAVAALCAHARPDVVHTHGYRPDVVDGGVARRMGIPVVTTVHGRTSLGWKDRLYVRLQQRAFRRFDAVVAVSRPLADTLRAAGVAAQRVRVIRNAWAAEAVALDRLAARRALGIPEHGFRVGWVGRLSAEKGWDVFLRALAAMGAGAEAPSASIIGDGPEAGAARALAGTLGLSRRLCWHGTVGEAARLYRAFDVFVLSSRAEGTPMVLFEAMAAGVPIVATAVGGVPDVLSPEVARLVPPGRTQALAAAILGVQSDPAAAAARARAARARLEHDFDVAAWAAEYERVYRSVMRWPASAWRGPVRYAC
jgi:glycosyltransferase involved in cell wall biosynthesis